MLKKVNTWTVSNKTVDNSTVLLYTYRSKPATLLHDNAKVDVVNTAGKDANSEQDVYRLLSKTFILLDDCDRQFFAKYGLNTRQYWTLQHLAEVNGCSMVDLSRVLFTDKSNVTGIVDRLEKLNLVKRKANSNDRRVILITLTEEGQRLHSSVQEQHNVYIHELMSVLAGSHLQSLLEDLHALSSSFKACVEQNELP